MKNNVCIKINQSLKNCLKGDHADVVIDASDSISLMPDKALTLSLESGEHNIKISFKYLGANCGLALTRFTVSGDQKINIEYNPPYSVSMGGSISIKTEVPENKTAKAVKQNNISAVCEPIEKASAGHTVPAEQALTAPNASNAGIKTVNKKSSAADIQNNKKSIGNSPALQKAAHSQDTTALSPRIQHKKSRYAAAALAFFLGSWGAHKFYLHNYKMGIAYLLFSWTYIPLVVSIIEAVMYLNMKDEAFWTKYSC